MDKIDEDFIVLKRYLGTVGNNNEEIVKGLIAMFYGFI
jgi:hypothetical protein